MIQALKALWRRLRKPLFTLTLVLLAMVFIQALPGEAAFWMAGETPIYLEALAGVWIAATLAAAPGAVPAAAQFVRRALAHVRAMRPPRLRQPRTRADDDEDEPATALAFA